MQLILVPVISFLLLVVPAVLECELQTKHKEGYMVAPVKLTYHEGMRWSWGQSWGCKPVLPGQGMAGT
jgi:hypothetical protein